MLGRQRCHKYHQKVCIIVTKLWDVLMHIQCQKNGLNQTKNYEELTQDMQLTG